MKFSATVLLALVTATNLATALTPAQWRGQSIYQVVTDRFARKFWLSTESDTRISNFGNGRKPNTYQFLERAGFDC